MKLFRGKEILTTLEELIDPTHAALFVVDVQNDFMKKKNADGTISYVVPEYGPLVTHMITSLDAARNAGVKIIYMQHTTLPKFVNESPARIRYRMYSKGITDPYELEMFTLVGSWGWEVIDEIAPRPEDLCIKKYRSSAFVKTTTDLLLKNSGIKTLVTMGVVTQGCVESTVRDALYHDYYIVIVTDGVGTPDPQSQKDSLAFMSKRFDMTTSDELVKLWNNF